MNKDYFEFESGLQSYPSSTQELKAGAKKWGSYVLCKVFQLVCDTIYAVCVSVCREWLHEIKRGASGESPGHSGTACLTHWDGALNKFPEQLLLTLLSESATYNTQPDESSTKEQDKPG